jgi:radical SAM protein (TIGR04043 family)
MTQMLMKAPEDLLALGAQWPDKHKPLRRGGAGPTDHAALKFSDHTLMVPLLSKEANDSPYRIEYYDDDSRQAIIFREGQKLGKVLVPSRPRFYDLYTADGIPYWKIAALHSHNVLATTVLQNCIRYENKETSCQFCAIGESLKQKTTIARKKPEQLAEVAEAAVRLDGVEHMVMTTGTPKGGDRGVKVLAECAQAIKTKVNIPIQAQCEPPSSKEWITQLYEAGVDSIGMHLEAVTQSVRERIMPGKAQVTLEQYFDAFHHAVKVFGKGQVSTYILAGLGDSEEDIVRVSQRLIKAGVYPFIVPFVPLQNTPLSNHPAPESDMMKRIYQRVSADLIKHQMYTKDIKAGCAKCGACSGLKSHE